MFATFFALHLVGCLDVPDYPHELQPVESITVMVQQKKAPYSTLLKVNPSDSATVTAKAIPEENQDDLTFKWFFVSESKDSLLKQGDHYSFYPNTLNETIPNKLIVLDLKSMAIPPVQYLVVPRFIALSVTTPILSFSASIVGSFAGFLIAYFFCDISFSNYMMGLRDGIDPMTFLKSTICKR